MLGSCWLQVASSWLQDGSRSLHVGSSWPQDALNGPQRPPEYSKMRPKWPKMASKSICFSFLVFSGCLPSRYVLASKIASKMTSKMTSKQFASGPTFSNELLLFRSLECINFCQFLDQISMNFESFLESWVVYRPRGLKIPS